MKNKLALFAAFFLIAGFSCTAAKKPYRNGAPNVILISVDTLRADHLSLYGYDKIETPNIDGLARDGVYFLKAYSHAPITLPSHISIFTGTYPNFHGVRDNGVFTAPQELNTMAEILKAAGYDTAAFVSALVMDSSFGIDQGFDIYDDNLEVERGKKSILNYKFRRAETIIGRAVKWIKGRAGSSSPPFFAFVHLFDPHFAYNPPEPFYSTYSDNLYDGEIAYTDSQIGVLIAKLKELGLYDNTLIIFTSDHGESLGEHGENTHAIFLYNSTIWVPLVMKLPGGKYARRSVKNMVRHIDILPTMLDIVDLGKGGEKMKSDIQGVSLLGAMRGDDEDFRLLSYAESHYPMSHYGWARPESIRSDEYEYINLPKREFYDLKNDPMELNNIYETQKELALKYARKLEDIKRVSEKGGVASVRRDKDAKILLKLISLGYIHGDVQFDENEIPDAKDPKDLIFAHTELVDIQGLINDKKYAQVIDRSKKALKVDPWNIQLMETLAKTYLKTGDTAGAVEQFQQIKKRYPAYPAAYVALGNIYALKEGNFDAAQKEFDAAFGIAPRDARIWAAKGNLEREKGELEEAERNYRRAVELDADLAGILIWLADFNASRNRLEPAEDFFLKAISAEEERPQAHYGLALLYEKSDRIESAEKEFRLAVKYGGENPIYYNNLGSILARGKKYDEAVSALQRALEIDPVYADALYNMGTAKMNSGKTDEAAVYFKKAIEQKPGMVFAYNNLAAAYIEMGDTTSALLTYKEMAKAAPAMPLPWYRMAIIAASEDRVDEAKKYLENAIERGGQEVIESASKEVSLQKVFDAAEHDEKRRQ